MPFQSLARGALRSIPWSVRNQIKAMPLIGPLQRWFVDTQLSGAPFVHEVDAGPAKGMKFEITLPEDKGIWTGCYEEGFSAYVAESVEPGMVGYDIGAWHGFFSGIMLTNGASEVVMFEPLPANLRALEAFVRLNPGQRISIQNVALGAEAGTVTLLQMEGTSMAKLEASPFKKDAKSEAQIDVRMVPLDLLIAEQKLAKPDILKIDIEGAELMMLQGAEETLAESKPVILAEIHSEELRLGVDALLKRHNYEIEYLETQDTNMREGDATQIRARRKAN